MRSRRESIAGRMRWVAVFAVVLLACSAIPVVAAEPEEPGFIPPSSKEEAIETQVPGARAVSQALGQVEREEEEREEWLRSPEAEKEREDSTFAFSDLPVDDSKELLAEVFGQQLETLNGDPGRVLSDSQHVEPIGDFGAVAEEEGQKALLEATVPIRAMDDGKLQGVDLSLEETPEGFETDNAVSDLVLPAVADEAIQVGNEGFGIAQSGAEDHSASPFGDKNLFYPSVLPDTDLLVAGTSLGAELFNLLRSKNSPEDLMFDLDLPTGSELQPAELGGVEIVRGEEQLIRIPAPTAIDAQGTNVPVELEVLSNSISLHVDHQEGEYQYPILVDPIVEDWVNQGNNWYGGANLGFLSNGAWKSSTNNSGFVTDICCWEGSHAGLLIQAKANAFFGSEQFAQWTYTTGNPKVIINHIWLIPFNRWDSSCGWSVQPHDYVGLWTEGVGWDPKPPWANYARDFGTVSSNGRGEALVIGMSSGPPGVWISCDRVLYAGGVGIWLEDEDLPVLSTAGSTQWIDSTPIRLNVSATDPGVGVKHFETSTTNTSGQTQTWTTTRLCTGLYGSRCPATWNLGDTSQPMLSYSPAVMPEGIRKLSIRALDVTLKPSTTTNVETVRIDHAPPTITLSGTVTEQAKLGAELPSYTLAAEATDGVPGSAKDEDARSGVVKLTFEENGKYVVAPFEKACGTQSCKMVQELEVPASKMTVGSHTITVKATDALGHVATKSITFSTGDTQSPNLSLSGLPGETSDSASAGYWSSFGTSGTGNGQFNHPAGMAVDSKGNLLVVDENNKRVQKFNEAGEYVSSFGSSGTGDGQFSRPTDVAVDSKGNIWVTDAGSNRVQKFTQSGGYITKFGTYGSGNGQFNGPESIAIDSQGNIWVGDTYNGRLQKFTEQGTFIKVIGSKGTGQGQMIEATGMDIGPNEDVWVADWGNNRVTVFNKEGGFVRQFGTSGSGNGQFSHPDVIEVDNLGNVWVADESNRRVQKFNSNGEYVTKFGTSGAGKGQFSFSWPMGLASDSTGSLWISDTGNNRVQRWLVPNVTVVGPLNPINVSASDPGFGVTSVSAKLLSPDGTTEVLGESSQSCAKGKCPLSVDLPEPDLSEKPEGVYMFTFSAGDAAGNKGKVSKVIGLDHTPPTITLSGTLAETANGPLNAPSGDLTIKADDSAGSGIREINVERDGRRVASFPYSCASNCGQVTALHRFSVARDGTERLIQKAPEPSGATLTRSTGVSCLSATSCTAVGYYVNSSGVTVPLAQRWNDTEWKVETPLFLPARWKASSKTSIVYLRCSVSRSAITRPVRKRSRPWLSDGTAVRGRSSQAPIQPGKQGRISTAWLA
jgi:sugar lactone lactonase YvrE